MPVLLQREILARHRTSLRGRLHARELDSEALEIPKAFYVYEPPGLATLRRVPLLYLFRGHEREWVNLHEDASRRQVTSIEALDRRIAEGTLPPMVAVLPGLNSIDNRVPSLGIDMAGTLPPSVDGLGAGRFWHYLTHELLPLVERDYPEARGGRRLAAGFSLGGFTVMLLALHLPGYFDHAGFYDGLFMWPDHHDPRRKVKGEWTDPVWCRAALFDAALGRPRDALAMRRWNPTDTLCHANPVLLDQLRATTFWIACAAGDGSRGNRDRAHFLVDLLRRKGLDTGFDKIILDPDAAHTWHWTDTFLMRFLDEALAAS